MNDEPLRSRIDDDALDELLARLKQLEPPLQTRVANRVTIAAELARQQGHYRQKSLPLWRRSITVPYPMAAAALVIAAVLSLMSFQSPRNESNPVLDSDNGKRNVEVADVPESKQHAVSPHTPPLTYRETSIYFCGIGPLRSETSFSIEE